MKPFYIFSILFYFCIFANAQLKITSVDPSMKRSNPPIILDTTVLRVQYSQKMLPDTSSTDSYKQYTILLQIGNRVSKYADYYGIMGDSVLTAESKPGVDRVSVINQSLAYKAGTLKENIFKNYPQNKITTTDRVLESYSYEEPMAKPKWKLESGSDVICGYTCKKATTQLFGRNYTAWYTPDIKINNGPWKFSGLPGLILKVEDDKKHFSFTCVSIEKPKWIDQIFISDDEYIKVKKKTFQTISKRFNENPGAYIQNAGITVTLDAESTKKLNQKKPYNPIELAD